MTEPDWHECSLCLGDGYIEVDEGDAVETYRCPECDGEGWVLP